MISEYGSQETVLPALWMS